MVLRGDTSPFRNHLEEDPQLLSHSGHHTTTGSLFRLAISESSGGKSSCANFLAALRCPNAESRKVSFREEARLKCSDAHSVLWVHTKLHTVYMSLSLDANCSDEQLNANSSGSGEMICTGYSCLWLFTRNMFKYLVSPPGRNDNSRWWMHI